VWRRYIASTWDAVRIASDRVECASHLMAVCDSVRGAHPRLARSYLRRAEKNVGLAYELKIHTFMCLLATGIEYDYPPSEMVRIISFALQVVKASDGLWQRLDAMLKRIQTVSAELGPDVRPRVPVCTALQRHHLAQRLRSMAVRILAFLQRRQRSRAAAPEDAPRRVSRGRAPPFLSAATV
jgi:hypothetical protein